MATTPQKYLSENVSASMNQIS